MSCTNDVLGGLGRNGGNASFLGAAAIPVFHPTLSSAVAMLSSTSAPRSSECTQLVPCLPGSTGNTDGRERAAQGETAVRPWTEFASILIAP